MKLFLFFSLFMLLTASCVARADSFYLSESAWAGALSGSPTTINFEGLVANDTIVNYGYGPGASIAVGGVNFATGPLGANNFFDLAGDGAYSLVSVISIQPWNLNYPGDLLITLPSAVTALGFDFNGGRLGTATVTLSDGSVQEVGVPAAPSLTFFGVTAPGGITTVDITLPATDEQLDMADFSYGTEATPEPSSFLLLASGLSGLAGMVKRKMRA